MLPEVSECTRMKNRIIEFITIAFLYLISTQSCIQDLDYERVYEKKVVVNCILAPGKEQKLRVSYNDIVGNYRFTQPKEVVAVLFCNGNEAGRFSYDETEKCWILKHNPMHGGQYRLVVSVPGFESVSAETEFPVAVPPITRNVSTSRTSRPFTQTREFGPYWVFALKQLLTESQPDYLVMRYPAATDDDHLIEDIGSDHPGVDDFNSLMTPVPVSYNVSGNTVSHYLYLRICPAEVQYPLTFSMEWSDIDGSLVYFRSVSTEYDKYLKTSLQKIMAVHNEDDPTFWFDESKVYNNINGGLGIFGAYCDYVIQINNKTDLYFNMGVPYDEWPFDI